MTFREGLLQARGQIAFITALALSTGAIIYLETLDTDDRIQSRVAAELAQRGTAPSSVSPLIATAIRVSLRRAEEAYSADPVAAANRAAMLTSLSTAVQAGVLSVDEGSAKIEKILDDIVQRSGEMSAALVSALGLTAVTFSSLDARITPLLQAP